ncbi:MAG: hypothetical protein JWQ28_453 [Pedobacter sp.]|nr:hypothetical protein [Pedobacter sp.]
MQIIFHLHGYLDAMMFSSLDSVGIARQKS